MSLDLGLMDAPELQVPLFIIFMLIYLTLTGNLGMITLILLDSRLHTPMYFLLSNLSLVDCVYSSAVTPKVMAGLLTGDKVISYGDVWLRCSSSLWPLPVHTACS